MQNSELQEAINKKVRLYLVTLIDFESDTAIAIICIARRNAVRARVIVLLSFYNKKCLKERSFNGTGIPLVISHTFKTKRAFFR